MSLLPASSIGDESTGFYNGVIDQSLRCEIDDNNELTFTPGSNGDAKHWTMSAWVKKVNITTNGTTRTILGVHRGGYADFIGFYSNDEATISLNNTLDKVST